MLPIEINRVLNGIPNMTLEQGREITDFIRKNELRNCLELGFNRGVSSAYIAHAVMSLGSGRVVAIDREEARQRDPNINTVLSLAGVPDDVMEVYFEPRSYNWRLMRFLEEGRAGSFDFVYLDGAHTWEVDGLASYLAVVLLRPGGWILFDDLTWSFEKSTIINEPWVQALPKDERATAQVRKVWDLLVVGNPAFETLIQYDGWGYAQKSTKAVHHTLIFRHHPFLQSLARASRMLAGRLHGAHTGTT
jgi:predicted O-methyltransferase YrrM